MEGTGLCITMDYSNLGGFHVLNQVPDHEVLAATLGTHQDEGIALVQPRLDHCDVSLDAHCLDNWRHLRVLEVVYLNI